MIKDLSPGDPVIVGPYRLLGRLGRGGMGQVYLGRSPGGRRVAVKLIRPELADDAEFRIRFAREVAAARGVSGMFTALVIDADTSAELPWLATAYVPGPSLAEAVATDGPLPLHTVLGLAAGLAEGLQAIHQAGVVHRDLKPSNVLLAADGPRVIDFGISRAREASMLTQSGIIVGTPGFLSPEQARGRLVGPPSDIFSLGGVLTYAATGEGPFGSGPTDAMVYRVVEVDPDLSGVPAELRPIVERCLAKDPAARPTAADLLAELDQLGVDIGVATPEWLPAAVADSVARYTPAGQATPSPDAVTPDGLAPDADAVTPANAGPDTPDVVAGLTGSGAAASGATASGVATDGVTSDGMTAVAAAVAIADAVEVDDPTVDIDQARAVGLAPGAGPGSAGPVSSPAPATRGPAGPAAPGGAGPAGPALPGGSGVGGWLRDRRRLILAGGAAAVLVTGIGIGVALSGGGPGRVAGGPTPSVLVSRASAPASTSRTPSPSPTPSATHKATATHKPTHRATASAHTPTARPRTTPAGSTAPPTVGSTTQPPPTVGTHPPSTPPPSPTHSATPPAPQSISGVSGATSRGCANYGSVASISGGPGVTFTFANHSSANMQVYYITTSGTLGPDTTVGPGGSYTPASAAADQAWLVSNAGGGCLGIVTLDTSGSVTVS